MPDEPKRKIIVSGHAIAPKGTVLYERNKLITVVLELDWETGTVLDAETTFMTKLANDFLKKSIIGKSIMTDFDSIRNQINDNINVDSKKSLLKALSIIIERFHQLRRNEHFQAMQISDLK